ncbi:hypothetical protein ONZ45_g13649 [Pleurotus djamor]|nr:hypothetical protein ONZ45_g13649 [Pleurotus djamor]
MSHPTGKEISFPPEILQQFIATLGADNRRVLRPLPLVSRQFRDLTIPILYESITIIPEPESIRDADIRPPPAPICVPSISIYSDRLNHLKDTISSESGQKLALYTKAFFMHPALWGQQRRIAVQTMEKIRTLLPYFSNLQRLAIIDINPRLKDVIPKTMLLTHLDICSDSENEILEVVARHPTLRVLAINIMAFFPSSNIERTVNLPDLHTYHGPSGIWKCIHTTSPLIRALSSGTLFGGVEPVQPYHSNLKILDISSSELQMYHLILPRLDRIEYLRVKMSNLAVKPEEFLVNLRQVPSRSFKYLSIQMIQESDAQTCAPILASIFREIPSLRMIDVKSPYRKPFSMSFETIRYRNTGPPNPVKILAWLVFGWWWHCVEDDLDDLVTASSQKLLTLSIGSYAA